MQPDEGTARVITLVILLVQAVVVVASTRLVSLINTTAVGLELALVVVVALALAIAVVVTGHGAAGNLTSRGITENAPDYFDVGGGLMIAMIMGLATLVGFDSAANLAEEAKDPFRSVPRAIVGVRRGRRCTGDRVPDLPHHRDRGHPTDHRERVACRGDHA
ncbi:amino acid permease [Streptomyces chartreusis]|uniref:amino acid permease n=1 Tax=Streptomyces chartreusis TaxID=1969 RepID=UPI002E18B18A|nr:amino acid permease [Streptomyces chartreusis]